MITTVNHEVNKNNEQFFTSCEISLTKRQLNLDSFKNKRSLKRFLLIVKNVSKSKESKTPIFCQSPYKTERQMKCSRTIVNECRSIAASLNILKKVGQTAKGGFNVYEANVELLDKTIKALNIDDTIKNRKVKFVEAADIIKALATIDKSSITAIEADILKVLLVSINRNATSKLTAKQISEKLAYSKDYISRKLRALNKKQLIKSTYNQQTQECTHQFHLLNLYLLCNLTDKGFFCKGGTDNLMGGYGQSDINSNYYYLHNNNVKKNVSYNNNKNDESRNKDASQEAASVKLSNKESSKEAVVNTVDTQAIAVTSTLCQQSEDKESAKAVVLFDSGRARVTKKGMIVGEFFASDRERETAIAIVVGYHRRNNNIKGKSKNVSDKQLRNEIAAYVKLSEFNEAKAINIAIKKICNGSWTTPWDYANKTKELSLQAEEAERLSKQREHEKVAVREAYVAPSVEEIEAQLQLSIATFDERAKVEARVASKDAVNVFELMQKQSIVPPTPTNSPSNTPSIVKQYPKIEKAEEVPVRPDTPMPVANKPKTILPADIPSYVDKFKFKVRSENEIAKQEVVNNTVTHDSIPLIAKELTDGIYIASLQSEEEKLKARLASNCLFENEAFKAELANKEEAVNNDDIDNTDISHITSFASFTSSYQQAVTNESSKEVEVEVDASLAARDSMRGTYSTYIKMMGIDKTLQMIEKSPKFDSELFSEAVDMYLNAQTSSRVGLKPS